VTNEGYILDQQKQGAKAVLKRENVTNPTVVQFKEATKKAVKEYFTILFLYIAHCR